MDNELADQLFGNSRNNKELEVVDFTGETLSTGVTSQVKMDSLFQRMDFDKTNEILQEDKPVKRKVPISRPSRGRKRSGLINEDYLRELVRDEMSVSLGEFADEFGELVTYTIEKVVRAVLSEIKKEQKNEEETDE